MAGKMSRVGELYREEGYASYLKRIEALRGAATNAHIALYQATKDFVRIAREEREAKRAEILRAYGRKDEIKFSNKIIYMGDSETGVILRWVEVWHPKGAPLKDGKPDVRYNNVRADKGTVSRMTLKRGAHPDEVDLLYEHNDQVKAFKEAWNRLVETRRSIKKMRDHGKLGQSDADG